MSTTQGSSSTQAQELLDRTKALRTAFEEVLEELSKARQVTPKGSRKNINRVLPVGKLRKIEVSLAELEDLAKEHLEAAQSLTQADASTSPSLSPIDLVDRTVRLADTIERVWRTIDEWLRYLSGPGNGS